MRARPDPALLVLVAVVWSIPFAACQRGFTPGQKESLDKAADEGAAEIKAVLDGSVSTKDPDGWAGALRPSLKKYFERVDAEYEKLGLKPVPDLWLRSWEKRKKAGEMDEKKARNEASYMFLYKMGLSLLEKMRDGSYRPSHTWAAEGLRADILSIKRGEVDGGKAVLWDYVTWGFRGDLNCKLVMTLYRNEEEYRLYEESMAKNEAAKKEEVLIKQLMEKIQKEKDKKAEQELRKIHAERQKREKEKAKQAASRKKKGLPAEEEEQKPWRSAEASCRPVVGTREPRVFVLDLPPVIQYGQVAMPMLPADVEFAGVHFVYDYYTAKGATSATFGFDKLKVDPGWKE